MQAAVEIQDLTKRYDGRTVVDGVSLRVEAGQILALLGANGAGKTTTVECAVGFRRPDAGSVRILGADPLRDRARIAEHLGVMLQEGGAYQAATPREMLRLYAGLYAESDDFEKLLVLVDLEGRADARFRTLSGGEKQRVNLALALVGNPRVLFLDEPTAGMDPAARHRTWGVIGGLRAQGVAILLTTHYLEEAERLADVVAIMGSGTLLATDSPERLTGAGQQIVVTTSAAVDERELAAGVGAPVHRAGPGRYVVSASAERVADVTAWFTTHGLPVTGVTTHDRTLEDVFLDLTGDHP